MLSRRNQVSRGKVTLITADNVDKRVKLCDQVLQTHPILEPRQEQKIKRIKLNEDLFKRLEMTSRRLSSFVEDLVGEVSNNKNLFHIFECVLRLHRLDERSHGRFQFLLKMFCYMVILKKFVFS